MLKHKSQHHDSVIHEAQELAPTNNCCQPHLP
jgi:hypothetical protein